jgi:hypothetical protein
MSSSSERFLVVPLYCRVGLYNQWISLQLATVLAWLTHRTLVLDLGFGFLHGGSVKQMFCHSGDIQGSDLQVTDLFDVPVRMRTYRTMPAFDAWIAAAEADTGPGGGVWTAEHWPTTFLNRVVQVDATVPASHTADFAAFRHGRSDDVVPLADLLVRTERVVRLRRADSRRGDPAHFYFAQVNSLLYATQPVMRAQIARVAASVQPKPHLSAIARALAASVQRHCFRDTRFVAVHLRRGDKVAQNPYIRALTSAWLVPHLLEHAGAGADADADADADLALVVCTDSPDDPLVGELRRAFPRMVLMDDELERHGAPLLAAVPFGSDTIVKAFVSSMACTHARRFFGTQGSTFSSYIQHVRGVRSGGGGGDTADRTLLYCYPNSRGDRAGDDAAAASTAPWSWQRRQTDAHSIGWFVVHPEDWSNFMAPTAAAATTAATPAAHLYVAVPATPLA